MIRRPPRSTRTEHAFPTRRSSDLEMLVSLNGRGRKPSFLKLRVSLELEKATDQARIQAVMPRIIDNFQVFLRELRIEELQGSQGLYRVKEELLARVHAAAYPTKVKDVLFKELLVQSAPDTRRTQGRGDGNMDDEHDTADEDLVDVTGEVPLG